MAISYEAVSEKTLPFGRNAYLEVTKRRLREGDHASDFLVLSRGFYESDGTKRWTKFVTIPDEPEVLEWLADAIRSV